MTTDQHAAAEEALHALARDLVEELAAGRLVALADDLSVEPLDPDSPGPLELAVFNVRPFQRTETTRTGRRVVESVRGHSASRTGPGAGDTIASGEHYVAGEPGHMVGHISEAKWLANQWKRRAQSVDRLHQAIQDTRQQMQNHQGLPAVSHDARHPASPLWRVHGQESDQHLVQAQAHLSTPDQPSLAEAYRHLAEAHRAGVEQVLPRARTPEETANVHAHLARVQAHMEALDKITGTKPDVTRKIVGTTAQHNERAAAVREAAHSVLRDAAETGDVAAVTRAEQQHAGLVEPDKVKAAHERAGQVAALRDAETPPMPPYHSGAAAVYPQAGTHPRTAALRPGATISGHDMAGRISPVQAAVAPNPADVELAQMRQQVERFRQREAQRAKIDLTAHLAELKAAEAAHRGVAPEGAYRPLSDQEFAAHKDFVARQVEKALQAGMATDQQYSLDGKGQVWSPERALAHGEIIKDFMDRHVDVPSDRQALFMGGLPGAGKSSTLSSHPGIDLKNYAVLNPDIFKEELLNRGLAPEVPGLSPLETAALVHEESAYLTDLAAHEMERRGKNVAWDVTMKNYDTTAARVRLLKAKGYRVHSVFVDVPVAKSADRVESRYRKGLEAYRKGTDPLGGRFIPRDVVLRGEDIPGVSRARTTFEQLKPEFASWELHNGTTYPARLEAQSSGPAMPVIPSVEALRRLGAGNTEVQARAAEIGQAAESITGLTQSNPSGTIEAEESESR